MVKHHIEGRNLLLAAKASLQLGNQWSYRLET